MDKYIFSGLQALTDRLQPGTFHGLCLIRGHEVSFSDKGTMENTLQSRLSEP